MTANGDGNSVSVHITNADGNTPVVLYYNSALYTGTQSQNIGNTSNNGTFLGNVSTSAYGIVSTSKVYALINGYQTPLVTWPYTTPTTGSNSAISFSQTNPTVTQGQTIILTVSGGQGSYYISSNNNQNTVQANISGNLLSLSGILGGAATVTICSSSTVCSNIVVTVISNNVSNGTIYLSQNNATITVGQTAQIIVTGGVTPYSTYYDGTNKVTTNVSGPSINITGVALGDTTVTVCAVSGGCAPIHVNVIQGTTPTSAIAVNIPVAIGQTLALPLSGGNGQYYISTPISTPFNATISGNKLYVVGTAIGTDSVTICSSATLCSTVAIAVSAESSAPTATTAPSTTSTLPNYIFTLPLYRGDEGNEVLKLQERLIEDGYLQVTPNGYYGPATTAAVKAFQRDHNLSPLGNVGPGTRAALNR